MSQSAISKLIAGVFAVLVSRELSGHRDTNVGSGQTREAENGDVIKVNRGAYDHYGVYIKQNQHVVHYTGATGPADFNGMVRETSLEEFLNGADSFTVCHFPKNLDNIDQLIQPIRIRADKDKPHSQLWEVWQEVKNSKLKDYHLYSGEETVARARSALGKEDYNIICNNCEHFAVWCRTGLRESSQVNKFLDVLVALYG